MIRPDDHFLFRVGPLKISSANAPGCKRTSHHGKDGIESSHIKNVGYGNGANFSEYDTQQKESYCHERKEDARTVLATDLDAISANTPGDPTENERNVKA